VTYSVEELLSQLMIAERYFTGTKYGEMVRSASAHLAAKDFAACKKELDKLPTQEQLLERLVKKLEGKSVERNLKKITKGQIQNKCTILKVLTSLLTHTVIEVEQGAKEYRYLFPLFLNKINEVVYDV